MHKQIPNEQARGDGGENKLRDNININETITYLHPYQQLYLQKPTIFSYLYIYIYSHTWSIVHASPGKVAVTIETKATKKN